MIRTLDLYLSIPPSLRPALMVADGMGVDSTAMPWPIAARSAQCCR
ncbi:MAG: hypothetical protein QUS11_06645 [Candidatus Fermentibacter sp.]|nr:hypothetical protein [Candidatus Fermentibacter sp.]